MPEKVEGYLTTDGRFFNDYDLCRFEDAKLSLRNCINDGITTIDEQVVFLALDRYTEQALEYLLARKAILVRDELSGLEKGAGPNDTNPRPITLEE